jgi:hypothetical protein
MRMRNGMANPNQSHLYLSRVSTFKMPNVKCCDSVRLRGFVKEFGEKYFTTDGVIFLM